MTKDKLTQKKTLLLYGIMLVLLLIYHFTIDLSYGDDGFFAHVLDDKSLNTFLTERYQWTTSRIVIESVYIPITQYAQWLWRILDSVIVVSIVWLVNHFFAQGQKWSGVLCCVVLSTVIPLTAVMGAGWITTTANYVWTVAAGMTALIPVKKWLEDKSIRWWEYLIYTPCLVYASNQEQMAALLLGFYLVFGIYLSYKKKIRWQYGIFMLISIFAVRFIANCPGNYWRKQHDIDKYFPEFRNFSLKDKLFVGGLTTGNYYWSAGNGNWIMAVVCAVALATLIWKNRHVLRKEGTIFKLVVASVPLLFHVLVGHLLPFLFHKGILHRGLFWLGLFWNNQLPEHSDYSQAYLWIEVVIFGLLFVCLECAVWWTMDALEEKLFFVILSAAGVLSRIIIGFSPSVYASGDRTTFFATFTLLCTAFYMIIKTNETQEIIKVGRLTKNINNV